MAEHVDTGNLLEDLLRPPEHDEASVRKFNRDHMEFLEFYVMDRYDYEAWPTVVRTLLSQPYVARTVIENNIQDDAEKIERIIRWLTLNDSKILLFMGERRSGKTTTAWFLAWLLHEATGRPVFGVGDIEVPDWAKRITRVDDAPPYAIIIWDELGRAASSRTSQTKEQRGIPGWLSTLGHDHQTLFAISQLTSMGDNAFYRLADGFVFKKTSMMQDVGERKGLGRLIREWKEIMPRSKRDCTFMCRDLPRLTFRHDVPDWWTYELSHAYNQQARARAGASPHDPAGSGAPVNRARPPDAVDEGVRIRATAPYPSFAKIAEILNARTGETVTGRQWRNRIIERNRGVDPKPDLSTKGPATGEPPARAPS